MSKISSLIEFCALKRRSMLFSGDSVICKKGRKCRMSKMLINRDICCMNMVVKSKKNIIKSLENRSLEWIKLQKSFCNNTSWKINLLFVFCLPLSNFYLRSLADWENHLFFPLKSFRDISFFFQGGIKVIPFNHRYLANH